MKKHHSQISNAILLLLALSGLAYQTLELFKKLMEKKTIVNIQFEMLSEHDHPAISVCINPGTFTPFQLAKIDDNFAKSWTSWEKYSKTLYERYNNKGYFNKFNKPYIIRSFKKTLKQWNELQNNYSSGLFDFDTILSNFSITTDDLGIQLYVNGEMVSDQKIPKLLDQQYFNLSTNPIESFDGIKEKCFTYFSMVSLNRTRLVVRDMDQITLILIPRENYYGLGFLPRIRLSLHSPNIVPSLDKSMIEIQLSSREMIYFSQTTINRYRSGYDTDCYDYNNGQFTSRHQCLVECLYNLNNGSLTNRYNAIKVQREDLVKLILGRIENVDNRCKNKCKIECQSSYYRFDQVDRLGAQVFSVEDNNDIIMSYAMGMRLTSFLRHSSSPDLIVRHYPEVTFLSLMCNFGGLLSMWTGLSILIICRQTFKYLSFIIVNYNFHFIKLNKIFQYKPKNTIKGPILIKNYLYYKKPIRLFKNRIHPSQITKKNVWNS